MNYYLIDYENVNKSGLDGVTKLSEDDTVCIFYTENADSLSFGLHKRLNETSATLHFRKVEGNTKNALDFQLATYLGYIIHENIENPYDYYIVTKDKGYENLIKFWRNKANIKLANNLVKPVEATVQEKSAADEPMVNSAPATKTNDTAVELNDLIQAVKELTKDDDNANKIAKMIQKYKTKSGIHNALVKTFPSKDNKTASKIYSDIKPLIANKKGA